MSCGGGREERTQPARTQHVNQQLFPFSLHLRSPACHHGYQGEEYHCNFSLLLTPIPYKKIKLTKP